MTIFHAGTHASVPRGDLPNAPVRITVSAVITVETTPTGVRVDIPTQDVPPDRLNGFLDWLRLEAIARQSRLTEDDAIRLAEDIKSDWWLANKHRFLAEA